MNQASVRGAEMPAAAASHYGVWLILTAGMALLTWPVATVDAGSGLDGSWRIALHLVASGATDAASLAFTYGPLGFLVVPLNVEPETLAPALAWTFGVHVALAGFGLLAARRAVGDLLAAPAVFGMLILLGAESKVPAVALLALSWAVLARMDRGIPLSWVSLAGVLGAVSLAIKSNEGILTLVIFGSGLLVVRRGWRGPLAFLGAATVAFLAVWSGFGNNLVDAAAWLRNALEVAGGYSSGMSYPSVSTWVLIGFLTLAFALGAVCAWGAMPLPRREATCLVLASAAYLFMNYKYGFVRQDLLHLLFAFSSLVVMMLAAPWAAEKRRVAAPAVLLALLVAFNLHGLAVGGSLGERLDPSNRLAALGDQVRLVLDPQEAALQRDARRVELLGDLELSAFVDAPLSQGVHVTPFETSAVWALGAAWDPLPVFQDYSAYTPYLDRLNSRPMEEGSGPETVLLRDSPLVDFHVAQGEGPRQQLALRCAYEEQRRSGSWHVLRKVPWRCSEERALSTVRATAGAAIPIPSAAPNQFVLAKITPKKRWYDSLVTALYRRTPATITLDPDVRFTIPVPLLPGGLIVSSSGCQGLVDLGATCTPRSMTLQGVDDYDVQFVVVTIR